jgi:hypothetical protein
MYLAVTLISAVLLGVGFVLQQRAAEEVPRIHFLHLHLIAELLHKPRWLGGIAAMVAGELLSSWAEGHVRLALAEPLLATSLLFALVLAVPLSGQALRQSEIIGALLLGGGVGVLALAQVDGSGPVASFGSPGYWWTAAAVALIAAVFVQAGRRRGDERRATLVGAGAGLVFGISDALTRRSVVMLDGHHRFALLTSWPGYAVVGAGIVGVWLMQSAFNSGPLHASLPSMTAGEPIAGMALGVLVFGDRFPVSPGWLALQSAGVVAMLAGVVLVARAPAFADLAKTIAHPRMARPRLPHLELSPPHLVLHPRGEDAATPGRVPDLRPTDLPGGDS